MREQGESGLLRRPPRLRSSGTIGVVALASPVRDEYLERGTKALESHGFRIKLGRSILARARYTAGSVAQRIEDLHRFWFDDEVDAIVCARGGFGSLELLEHLDVEALAASPKIFMGASDLTAMNCLLGSKGKMISFHGPMVAQKIARGDDDHRQWVELLGQTDAGYRMDWAGARFLHSGSAQGRLWGGCLSLLVSLVGTPYFPDLRDSILFVEDIGVKPYQLDRMLLQLHLAGHLVGVRGIVFGEMLNCDQHSEQGYTVAELLTDLTRSYRVPVVFGYPSGHTSGASRALPIGARVSIDDAGIQLLEGVVA